MKKAKKYLLCFFDYIDLCFGYPTFSSIYDVLKGIRESTRRIFANSLPRQPPTYFIPTEVHGANFIMSLHEDISVEVILHNLCLDTIMGKQYQIFTSFLIYYMISKDILCLGNGSKFDLVCQSINCILL